MNSKTPSNWPKGMLFTDPFSFKKVYYGFPQYSEIDSPSVEWIFSIVFGNLIKHIQETNMSLKIGTSHLDLKKHGKDILINHLPANGFGLIIEPKVTCSLLGGKGGFGSMLRAQGGRMNSKKSTNNDACRDLSGRRLKTVRTAERLAEYQEGEAQRAKIQKEELEKRIAKKLKVPVKRKILFDDNEYLEQSEQLKLGVRSAVNQAVSSHSGSSSKGPNKRVASVFDDDLSDSSDESDSAEASDSGDCTSEAEESEDGEESSTTEPKPIAITSN
ncbi:hypothetical protein DSO57_1010210 [Entomophthora muscae]|uniref:Uncharacterized protein n=1 Tax=Entomophthora muscae TaxID=34485 RepID=A0ACC2RLG1_9FUNG|nr:hypothetical protein DSO57_1010210 [Entomophthora muscae]